MDTERYRLVLRWGILRDAPGYSWSRRAGSPGELARLLEATLRAAGGPADG